MKKNNNKKLFSILIVDDEKTVIDALKRILQILGYNVYTAMNGKDGLKAFKKNKNVIEVIFSDMIMPGLSGKELFYEIKKIKPEVKFVVISAYSIANEISQMLKDGLNGFIQKPFSVDNLKSVLSELIPANYKDMHNSNIQ